LKNTVAPILLIILVLGIIFVGIATPVEAAGIGTFCRPSALVGQNGLIA